ncbi:MAG: hypothetical protein KGM99_20825, partial [Burkholderiales bacterium]|nr:hypothetical protein [Burkholderiales bacterium]
ICFVLYDLSKVVPARHGDEGRAHRTTRNRNTAGAVLRKSCIFHIDVIHLSTFTVFGNQAKYDAQNIRPLLNSQASETDAHGEQINNTSNRHAMSAPNERALLSIALAIKLK